jgi:histidinol-phosphatase (PHP family)
LRANYHSHTTRCQHASGTEAAFVEAALANGFDILGFSDHSPWPYPGEMCPGVRMRVDELEGYVETVRALARAYEGRIQILCALECEYVPEYLDWLREVVDTLRLDYLVLGNHFSGLDIDSVYFGRSSSPEDARLCVRRTIAGMETGLFRFLAHPDFYLQRHTSFGAAERDDARELCRAAKALGVPLEFNLLGFRNCFNLRAQGLLGYPCAPFWEIAAAEGCKALVGLDAHHVRQLEEPHLFDLAKMYLEALGFHLEDTPIQIPKDAARL